MKRTACWIAIFTSVGLWVTATTPLAMGYDHPRDHGHQHRADPDDYDDPEDPCCEEPEQECTATGSSVLVANGNLILHFTDLNLNSPHSPLVVQRTYNSRDVRSGGMGNGWTSNLELRAIPITDGQNRSVLIRWPSGHRHRFDEQPDGSYAGPLGNRLRLSQEPSGNFILTTPGGETRYEFDADGMLIRTLDRNGNAVEHIYDPTTGCLEQVISPGGRSAALTIGGNGKLAAITDHAGRILQYEYDSAGNLIGVIDPLGNVTTFTYDGFNRLTSVFDPLGQQTVSVTYDVQGRVSRLVDKDGDFSYAYLDGETQKINNEDGALWTYTYDGRGVIRDIFDPLGNVTRRFYDEDYNLVLVLYPHGNAVQYSYDADGNLLEIRKKESVPGAQFDYFEGFDSGNLGPEWATRSTSQGRIRLTTSYGPHSGSRHLVMDDYYSGSSYSLNEVTLTLDLSGMQGATNAELSFWWREFSDESHSLPASWTGSRNGDGVAISADGNTWYRVCSLTGGGSYRQATIDLDAAVAAAGIDFTATFRIRFQQYDNYPATTDGIAIDDIVITGDSLQIPPPPEPSDIVTSYTYNDLGLVETVIDPLGVVTRYEYDGVGNRTRLIEAIGDPLGRETTFTYDANGNLLTVTDPAGNITTYAYDAAGNLIQEMDALGNVTSYTYNVVGYRTSTTDPLGNTTSYAYDANGNILSVTDPLGNTTQMIYDENGRLSMVTDAESHTTTYEHDLHGRRAQVTDPLGNMTSYEYDGSGWLTMNMDANGNTTTYTYDLAGRLIAETNALGYTTIYGYDAAGNRTSLTDANGNTTTFEYDAVGHLTTTTYPDGTFEQLTYDDRSYIVAQADRMDRTTTFSYDALGRLVGKAYPDASTTTFAYDVTDNVTTATNDAVALSFTYDALGRVLSESNDTWVKTVTYTYDAMGNRATMTAPEGQTATYSYDAAVRLTQISHPVMGTVTYSYDAVARRVAKELPNGTTTTCAYDGARRLLSIDHRKSDGSLLLGFTYTVDAVGNRTSMADNQGVHNYSYDAVYQLTAAIHPNPAVNPNEAYTYDAVGNRLVSHQSSGYTYDNINRLLENDDFTYEYDANGNQVSRTEKAVGAVTQYTYDFDNRLTEVDLPDGTIAAYYYDALGRRVKMVTEGVTRRYTYAGDDIIEESDDSGVQVALYLHGPAVDDPVLMERSATGYYYHEDALGSICVLTEAGSIPVASYQYDSFGQILAETGQIENTYTYTGRELGAGGTLYYYRARYYSPDTGRFLSCDPLWVKIGGNPYAYVQNNPINRTDPTGLRESPVRVCYTTIIGRINHTFLDADGKRRGFAARNFWLVLLHPNLPHSGYVRREPSGNCVEIDRCKGECVKSAMDSTQWRIYHLYLRNCYHWRNAVLQSCGIPAPSDWPWSPLTGGDPRGGFGGGASGGGGAGGGW